MTSANHTGLCSTPNMMLRIANLTISYTDKSQERNIVLGQLTMVIVALLFMSGILEFRATLSPKFRLVLSWALALFLPVMSYFFSEAKDAARARNRGGVEGIDEALHNRTWNILSIMLLVELLSSKVYEIRMLGYSEIIQRAGRFVWLGVLMFFNTKSIGRRITAGYLWMFCAAQLVQRIVLAEVHRRSHPDHSWLISSYMAQILHHQAAGHEEVQPIISGDELLRRCKYIVMGEEKLEGEVTADGYRLNLDTDADPGIITVGKVWRLAPSRSYYGRNKRLCLSFALFKLLRRRFEHLPVITKEEAMDCRDLFKNGLYDDNRSTESSIQLFQVMVDEVTFLSEYYHSVVPVVLASPSFITINYLLEPAALFALSSALLAFLLYGHGNVIHAWRRFRAENHPIGPKVFICTLVTATHSRPALFFMIDYLIYFLLAIILGCAVGWESIVVLYSNWYTVSVICKDIMIRRPLWRISSPGVRNKIRLKQFSLLDYRGPPVPPMMMMPFILSLMKLTSVPVADKMKQSVVELLVQQLVAGSPDDDDAISRALTNGTSALRRNNLFDQFRWACDSESAAEVILTWHIATCLLESKRSPRKEEEEEGKVAMGLSKYCAYLVVFHPELLPDRVAKAELVFKDARKELRGMLGFWSYYFSFRGARTVSKILDCCRDDGAGARHQQAADSSSGVVPHGAKLAMQLMEHAAASDDAARGRQLIWKVLAEVWAELAVYVAPSSDEAHLKGHADILPEGVELITVLWAFAMHTGISRPPNNTLPVELVQDNRV